MPTLSGGLTAYLPALGRTPQDPLVTDLQATHDGPVEVRKFSGPPALYMNYTTAGVGFLFEHRLLASITFYTGRNAAGFDVHDPDQPLVDGLRVAPSRDEVRALLGPPFRHDGEDFDVYEVDGSFVQFSYDAEMRATRIAATPDLPHWAASA